MGSRLEHSEARPRLLPCGEHMNVAGSRVPRSISGTGGRAAAAGVMLEGAPELLLQPLLPEAHLVLAGETGFRNVASGFFLYYSFLASILCLITASF